MHSGMQTQVSGDMILSLVCELSQIYILDTIGPVRRDFVLLVYLWIGKLVGL